MKSILTFIHPEKQFNKESKTLVKVQIDNKLELGWKKEDIMLITNFNYEYRGIEALVVEDEIFCEYSPISTKINAIVNLFERGLIEDELYWAHDFDAFQLVEMPESEIELGDADMGVCPFARKPKFAGGSVFFKKGAKDMFERIKKVMYEHKAVDENALTYITDEDAEFKKRIKIMNISYNFLPYNISSCYEVAVKPIRVAHFHPYGKTQQPFGGTRQLRGMNALEIFKGKNKLNKPLIPERLIKLFDKYEIK